MRYHYFLHKSDNFGGHTWIDAYAARGCLAAYAVCLDNHDCNPTLRVDYLFSVDELLSDERVEQLESIMQQK